MKNFDCCNELMSLILNPEIGEIILKCESCKNEIRYYYENKMELSEDLDDYLKLMKKNIMWFENVKVYEKVKLIGKNSKNEDVIAITEVTNQNRVQVNKERVANRKKWAEKRKEKRTTVILNDSRTYKLNPDLTEKQKTFLEICLLENNIPLGDWFINLLCGGSITGTEYYDRLGIPQEGDKWWDYRYKNLKHRDFIEFCFVIDKDVEKYVYDERTKEGKRWKAEKKHAQSKKEREIEKEHKLKYETLLHDIENEKKYKERLKDIVDRDRHGFDENSFIGEPYHGQKRKK